MLGHSGDISIWAMGGSADLLGAWCVFGKLPSGPGMLAILALRPHACRRGVRRQGADRHAALPLQRARAPCDLHALDVAAQLGRRDPAALQAQPRLRRRVVDRAAALEHEEVGEVYHPVAEPGSHPRRRE